VSHHVDAAGGNRQNEMCDEMRVSQRQLERDEGAHRLANEDCRRPNGPSHVLNEAVVAGNRGMRRYRSQAWKVEDLGTPRRRQAIDHR
jgi:hypothetical protein